MNDPKRFVPFVLEASGGQLGPEASAFLEYLKTLCPFPIFLRFLSIISVEHNAQMALRWVRYLLRYPI